MRAVIIFLALAVIGGGIAAAADKTDKPPKDLGEFLGQFVEASAQLNALQNADRITVTASGRSSIPPDVAEVRASVSGSAAMAADALKKFRDNRRRAIEAIKKLKLDNLTVEGNGLAVSSANANANRMVQVFGGNQNAGTPGHVTVTENLVIRLASIDRMKEGEPAKAVSTMIDAAKDAGLTLGGTGGTGLQSELVRFRSTKLDDARAAAVQSAMEAARRKAEALANLSKAKIVRIISSREIAPSPAANNNSNSNWFMMIAMAEAGLSGGGDPDEAVSAELKPIPVNVTIEVQFAAAGGQ
jgi:uncharacterized protein YggE